MKNQNKKLVLGTVQLGLKYGLNNPHGQPTQEESFSILDAAIAFGIDTFDTAWAYGSAEDVIGAWISSRSLAGKVKIISKMKPHSLNDYPDGTKFSDAVKMQLDKSLKRLGIGSLDGYLFHSPHYIYMSHAVEGMKKAKQAGLVNNIGVSVYDEAEALQAAELGVDYIQVPYNAFDQRLDSTAFFDLADKKNIAVFARSPFLQGLLLMKPDDLPPNLAYLRSHLERFIEVSKAHGYNQVEAAMIFVNEKCRADNIVFGVDSVEQLAQDFKAAQLPLSAKSAGFADEIAGSFKDLNKGAINPSLWSKIKF